MNETTKKCPICAEEIKTEARVCRYCKARFDVTIKGYCSRDRQVVDADTNGNCPICHGELMDTRFVSTLIEEKNLPPARPVQSQRKSSSHVLGWVIGIGLILVGTCFMMFKYMQPAIPVFLNTETPHPTVTPRSTSTNTATPTHKPTQTPTPAPVEVTIDTISSYPVDRLVILVRRIVDLGSTHCDVMTCGLVLRSPSNSSQKIPIFVNIPYGENTPGLNEMKPLHDNFSTYDIRLRTVDGEYAFVGQTIRITGRICETTDGKVCVSDIFKIELVR